MPKLKKKLTDFQQVDGKVHKEDETGEYEITSLDQLFYGDSVAFSKYNTLNIEEYENQINEMNTAELRRHAIEVAHVIPSTSAERLKKRLVLEFKKHVATVRTPKITHKTEKKPTKAVLDVMRDVK